MHEEHDCAHLHRNARGAPRARGGKQLNPVGAPPPGGVAQTSSPKEGEESTSQPAIQSAESGRSREHVVVGLTTAHNNSPLTRQLGELLRAALVVAGQSRIVVSATQHGRGLLIRSHRGRLAVG